VEYNEKNSTGSPSEKMSALLQRIIKKPANLASASIAHAKTAVFHTFHEDKVKNNLGHWPLFIRTVGDEMR
jgi:hypothetical protein